MCTQPLSVRTLHHEAASNFEGAHSEVGALGVLAGQRSQQGGSAVSKTQQRQADQMAGPSPKEPLAFATPVLPAVPPALCHSVLQCKQAAQKGQGSAQLKSTLQV